MSCQVLSLSASTWVNTVEYLGSWTLSFAPKVSQTAYQSRLGPAEIALRPTSCGNISVVWRCIASPELLLRQCLGYRWLQDYSFADSTCWSSTAMIGLIVAASIPCFKDYRRCFPVRANKIPSNLPHLLICISATSLVQTSPMLAESLSQLF